MKNYENTFYSPCIKQCGNKKKTFGFLHIGGDVAVRTDDIIGIFDIDNTTVSKHTRSFLSSSEKRGRVKNLAPDIPVSFVVAASEKGESVYLSQYSPRSLTKHCEESIMQPPVCEKAR